jgi:hypothetical protein
MKHISAAHWAVRWGKYGFFATAVLGGFAAGITYRLFAYWEGYKTFESPPTLSVVSGFFLITAVCGLLAIASAVFLFVSAAFTAPRRYVDLGLILIVIVLFVVLWKNTRNRQYYFLSGMREWVSERVSVGEIEEWFRAVERKEKSLSKTEMKLIDSSEWPPCVKRLSPSSVSLVIVDGVSEGNVVCGGGFLHWGLAICDRQEIVARQLGEYIMIMKVGPTSYVFVDAPGADSE